MYKNQMSLFNSYGQRKYLNQKERLRFLEITKKQSIPKRLFCQLIYFTGARIAEIHNLTKDRIDASNGTIVIETLKKRQPGVFRELYIPEELMEELNVYCQGKAINAEGCLWPFSLRTASRYIKNLMKAAGIEGVRSSSKGLRHGFAVHIVKKLPLPTVSKWLGHSDIKTTVIYLDIVGEEERELARSIW